MSQVEQQKMAIAHGVLMGLAFAVIFPSGAIIMRLFHFKGLIWVHAATQSLAYILALAGLGLGVWIAVNSQQLVTSNGHAIIGIVVVGILLFQAGGGLLAHSTNGRFMNVFHKWLGRATVTLGAINGGLGLQLAANTTGGEIAYGVVAGVFFLLYFAVIAYTEVRDRRQKSYESSDLEDKN
ncbi:hypothetical protein MBLNU457_4211t1 [Dothideomycetes sp. NU457]